MSKANKAKGGNRTVVIAAIGLAIVVAALLLVWRTMGPQSAAGGKTVTVQVVHEDGSSRDFTLNTDEEFLGAALIADGVVEDRALTACISLRPTARPPTRASRSGGSSPRRGRW